MVRIPGFHCCGSGATPDQGAEMPQATKEGGPFTTSHTTHTLLKNLK